MANRVIAIGGVPGTGKTTLMKKIIEFADDWEVVKPIDLLDSIYSKTLDTYILGKYQPYYDGEGYAQGTDRLSMAVQPKAQEFVKTTTSNIIFEGDRLFNQSFLEFCHEQKPTHINVLTVSKDTLESRYKDRGSEQSEKFLQGRETKYANIATNFVLMSVTKDHVNENEDDQNAILNDVRKQLEVV